MSRRAMIYGIDKKQNMVGVRAFAESRHFWTNPFVQFIINLWNMTTGVYRSMNVPVIADFSSPYHIVIEIHI